MADFCKFVRFNSAKHSVCSNGYNKIGEKMSCLSFDRLLLKQIVSPVRTHCTLTRMICNAIMSVRFHFDDARRYYV